MEGPPPRGPSLRSEPTIGRCAQGLLAPDTLLDVLRTCAVFMETDDGKRVKVVCRYQQYRAARRILQLGDNLFEAFPHATRIAFTGTPLITEKHGARRTVKRFGDYIDTYKLMDAVHDGATLQILYEGRTADTALKDKAGFEQKFEDLFRQRSEEEIAAIKKKYGTGGDLLEAEQRIGAIARDLVAH